MSSGCKRGDILDKLKTALDDLETQVNSPNPIPSPKAVLRGESHECRKTSARGPVTYSPTMDFGGAEGIPNRLEQKQPGQGYTPHYPQPCQNLHSKMSCYNVPQVLNPSLCDCPGQKGQNPPPPRPVIKDNDYCTSGINQYICPPDGYHQHWSPYHGTCKWPKPCPASCFNHSHMKDWHTI